MALVDHSRMANAIRALAMDAVEKANSGHPGLPMGAADIATVLFSQFLKFDAAAPRWPDRDRFILSAGHGSMLLYALLYLTGNSEMTLDEIKRFLLRWQKRCRPASSLLHGQMRQRARSSIDRADRMKRSPVRQLGRSARAVKFWRAVLMTITPSAARILPSAASARIALAIQGEGKQRSADQRRCRKAWMNVRSRSWISVFPESNIAAHSGLLRCIAQVRLALALAP